MFVPDDRIFLNNQTVLAASQQVCFQEVWSFQTIVAAEFSHPILGHSVFLPLASFDPAFSPATSTDKFPETLLTTFPPPALIRA